MAGSGAADRVGAHSAGQADAERARVEFARRVTFRMRNNRFREDAMRKAQTLDRET
jgi:hypothetical protein